MNETVNLFQHYHRMHHLFFQCVSRVSKDQVAHPSQGALLGCLMEKGRIRQAELCRNLMVSGAAVAVSIKRLERQGLLERVANPKDLREKLLCLTPEGERTAREIRSAISRVQEQAVLGFAPAEMETLSGYFKRICDNLAALKEASGDLSPNEEGER